jgi:phosphoesterase RecJ-like protein
MTIDLAAAADFLRSHDNFCILTHRRPDGDTVGCAVSLCRALRECGKRAVILRNPQFTPRYAPYLDGLVEDAVPENACIVSVDTATVDLLLLGAEDLADRIELAIDHHGTNSDYAQRTLVRSERAACGELIYELLLALDAPISAQTAEAIYVAISTDTGCFRYSNTTANTLRVAAEMKERGADTYRVNKHIFSSKTFARLRLEAYLVDTMQLLADGRVGVCALPEEKRLALGATEDDVDDIAGFARGVEGVQIAVMLREVEGGKGKVSVRTDGDSYSSAALCAPLGGGGHAGAAGATVAGGIESAREQILASIADQTGWTL